MTKENIKQIIPFLRSAEYIYQKTFYNDYTQAPRPTYNFLIMKEGQANLIIDGKPFTVKKNDVLWIPKGAKYSVTWEGAPASFSVLHFNFSNSFDPFLEEKTAIQLLDFEDLQSLLEDFEYLKSYGLADYTSISVFYHVFSLLFPLIEKTKYEIEQQLVIQPAINYIKKHYREKIQVKTLSELCFISQSRFEHLFKKIMGISPITYKNNLLMQSIQRTLILDKTLSLQAIADLYGFESTAYFCRLFKKTTGLTPSQYKKMNALV